MAGASRDAKGWRTSVTIDGIRHTIRLPSRLKDKQAASAAAHVEALATARHVCASLNAVTVAWLAELSDGFHARLADLGLTPARVKAETVTLGMLRDRFDGAVRVSSGTAAAYKQ